MQYNLDSLRYLSGNNNYPSPMSLDYVFSETSTESKKLQRQ